MMKRPESTRPKMPLSQRAKQFAPFKAVDGLYIALRRAEEEHSRMMEATSVVSVPLEEETDGAAENYDNI